jgi:hypothetical protein
VLRVPRGVSVIFLSLVLFLSISDAESFFFNTSFHCSESVTISVFVLSGSQLKATVSLEGPFAQPDVDSGVELHTHLTEFENGRKPNGHLSFSQVVDFEHLNEDIPDDDEARQENDDILKTPIDPNDPDADKKRRERRERQRQKFLEEKQKREERKMAQLKKVRQDGEPFVYTTKVPITGWYRMCVTSSWNQVSAMRESTKQWSVHVKKAFFLMFRLIVAGRC